MNDRSQIVQELARLERPLKKLQKELSAFGWNCESELYDLTIDDLKLVLAKYLDETIDETILSSWASALEMREDLGYEAGYEKDIATLLFELSSPEINRPITKNLIQGFIKELKEKTEQKVGENASRPTP